MSVNGFLAVLLVTTPPPPPKPPRFQSGAGGCPRRFLAAHPYYTPIKLVFVVGYLEG